MTQRMLDQRERLGDLGWTNWLRQSFGELADNASPTSHISVVVGYDADGWEVWEDFRLGDLVQSAPSGEVWRIGGFTKDDQILCRPHGLDQGRKPRFDGTLRPTAIRFDPTMTGPNGERGLDHFPKTQTVISHVEGLISFT